MKISEEKIKEILERGVVEVIDKEHLKIALKSGKKLRVKFGIDPTAPDLHLGHAVLLRKLRQFQNVGHQTLLIIGDFTARIGDPSGKENARKTLSEREIKNNLKKYLVLAGKIINVKKSKIYYNSQWYKQDGVAKILRLLDAGSIQQAIRREDFQKRLQNGDDVTLLEAFYSLLQGYDSVEVKADVELGGADQKLNLLAGRKIQRHFRMPEQDIMILPLLEGTNGVRKMSKSFGNYIALDEKPDNMFGKIMSVPDNLLEKYFLLSTDVPTEETKKLLSRPFEAKKVLAYEIIKLYHGESAAKKAREYFEKTFSKKETPLNLKIYSARAGEEWSEFLARENFVKSKSEAKRLIEGGGLDFNGRKIARASEQISGSGTVKIGKRKFIKIDLRA